MCSDIGNQNVPSGTGFPNLVQVKYDRWRRQPNPRDVVICAAGTSGGAGVAQNGSVGDGPEVVLLRQLLPTSQNLLTQPPAHGRQR